MRVPELAGALQPRHGARLVVWAAVAAAITAAPAQADYANRIGVMLGGGAYKLAGGGSDHTKIGPWGTVGLRYGWTRRWDIESSYRYGFNWDDTQSFRTRTTGFEIGALFNGRPDGRWTWQAFGGSGVLWWNVMDFRARSGGTIAPASGPLDSAPTASGFREDGNAARLLDSNFKVFTGLGVETAVFSSLTFRIGVRVDYLIRQTTDNTGASDTTGVVNDPARVARAKARVDANDLVGSAFGALTWWFGGRDRDDDGIMDKNDACPDEAEDKDGFQDEDGCPDLDNDNDGVADATDKCPNEAEDKDGFEDDDGCPDPDNDKDGVLDGVDRCPLEAEDADQFEDEDGCPDADNDGDGVLDGADQCPDTPPATRVDGSGCPLAKTEQERQLLDTGMIRLSGVKFDSGKAEIKPEFGARLDSVAAVLKQWPILKVEIAGHTDSRGGDAMNQRLSERRAQAVVDYLKAKDPALDATKFSVRGFGESVPIADNATAEGQALNRRVEFKVLNRDELDAEIKRRTSTPSPAVPPAPQAGEAVPTPAPPAEPPPSPAPADSVPKPSAG
jgi:outer membrane protein OmpA-like peptidoglycan-associated protein